MELESQRSELERLQAERDVKAGRARLEVYNREMVQMGDLQSVKIEQVNPHTVPQPPAPHSSLYTPWPPAPSVQDSITINGKSLSHPW